MYSRCCIIFAVERIVGITAYTGVDHIAEYSTTLRYSVFIHFFSVFCIYDSVLPVFGHICEIISHIAVEAFYCTFHAADYPQIGYTVVDQYGSYHHDHSLGCGKGVDDDDYGKKDAGGGDQQGDPPVGIVEFFHVQSVGCVLKSVNQNDDAKNEG